MADFLRVRNSVALVAGPSGSRLAATLPGRSAVGDILHPGMKVALGQKSAKSCDINYEMF